MLFLLANLVYRCPFAQNKLCSIENGLLQVLSLCGTNVYRPLRREYAILCIRNACEGNEANVRIIQSLSIQDVESVDNDALAAVGLKVEFNKITGNVEVKRFVPEK